MIPTLRSETLVFATTSQPRSARTRSAPWAASNSLTATSIRPRSGASPREGIFALSMLRSDDTRGLVESSCARTRPTPPSPTIATFTRTASRWGWICLSGQNSPMTFFPTRAAAALGDCSWGSRLHQGAREATDRSHAEHPEGSAMVRLLAGLIQDRFHELHGPDVWPHGECPAGHVHE